MLWSGAWSPRTATALEPRLSFKTRAFLVLVVGTVLGLGLSFGGEYFDRLTVSNRADDLSLEQARLFAEVMERIKE